MLVSASRTFPVAVPDAYDVVLATALPDWLRRWHLALPPVKAVTGETGAWGSHVGQTRTLHLGDGSTALETLTTLDGPHEFTYSLTELTGPLTAAVATVAGRFGFEPAGTGTRLTWSWDITPATPLGPLVLPALGWMWRGMATRALADLEPTLVPA